MKNNYTYYLTKLCEIKDPGVQRLFEGLRFDGGWEERAHENLTVFHFLSLYFGHTGAGKIKLNNVTPSFYLDEKVSSLAGSEVYVMCQEVARGVGEHFEGHENRKVLVFLKTMMKKLKKPAR